MKPAREGFEPPSTNGGACREDRGGSHYLSWPPCWPAFREGDGIRPGAGTGENACLNVCINEVMTNADGRIKGFSHRVNGLSYTILDPKESVLKDGRLWT